MSWAVAYSQCSLRGTSEGTRVGVTQSNPEMLTSFARRVGLEEGPWRFEDVFGLDPDLLAMVPKPVHALTLLFPTAKMGEFKAAQRQRVETEGQVVSDELFYIQQVPGSGVSRLS
jgi:ubiquitin carboxyl-terminal hydrolase L3